MATQYLTDSNAVIEFLGAALPASGSQWMQQIVQQHNHHLSIINQIELLGFNGSPTEMQTLEAFVQYSSVLPLSDAVVARTIDLRKTYKIKLPDAMIAATALVHGLTLITRNTSDFRQIASLQVVNAHDQ